MCLLLDDNAFPEAWSCKMEYLTEGFFVCLLRKAKYGCYFRRLKQLNVNNRQRYVFLLFSGRGRTGFSLFFARLFHNEIFYFAILQEVFGNRPVFFCRGTTGGPRYREVEEDGAEEAGYPEATLTGGPDLHDMAIVASFLHWEWHAMFSPCLILQNFS